MKNALLVAITSTLLCLALVVALIKYGDSTNDKQTEFSPVPIAENEVQNNSTPQGSVSLVSSDTVSNSSDTSGYSIVLTLDNASLSAVSMRLIISYSKAPEQETQLLPDPQLDQNGWAYPVKTAYLNSQDNTLVVDIAAVNLTPTGYQVSGDFKLADIELDSTFIDNIISYSFDKDNTKIIAKSGEEIKVNLSSGTKLIKN